MVAIDFKNSRFVLNRFEIRNEKRGEKNETPERVALTFARARFESNEEPDDEILSFAF